VKFWEKGITEFHKSLSEVADTITNNNDAVAARIKDISDGKP
jgi:hypothetical protein